MTRAEIPYQPFYCEENIWALIGRDTFATVPCGALFISNAYRHVVMAGQKAGVHGWVVWDYHVVLLQGGAESLIWDPNTLWSVPEESMAYLEKSFPTDPAPPPEVAPLFRLVPRDEFLDTFETDRRHMRTAEGQWHAPPPAWTPPGPGHTLPDFIDMKNPSPGALLDLAALRAHPWCTRN